MNNATIAQVRNKLTLPTIILQSLLEKKEISERQIELALKELESISKMLEPSQMTLEEIIKDIHH